MEPRSGAPAATHLCFFVHQDGGQNHFGGYLMLDIKRIRNDFDEVAQKLATRGVAAEKLAELK